MRVWRGSGAVRARVWACPDLRWAARLARVWRGTEATPRRLASYLITRGAPPPSTTPPSALHQSRASLATHP